MMWTLIALAVYVLVVLAYLWGCHVGYRNCERDWDALVVDLDGIEVEHNRVRQDLA